MGKQQRGRKVAQMWTELAKSSHLPFPATFRDALPAVVPTRSHQTRTEKDLSKLARDAFRGLRDLC